MKKFSKIFSTHNFAENMAYLELYIGIISGQKGSERFAEPQNRTSNLPNLLFVPKTRTSNLPNLKKPNEPPNRTRFDPTLNST